MALGSFDFYLLVAILAMAGVTLFTRMMPIILPKHLLDSPLLLAVNRGLPLAVMTLLILTSLQWQNTDNHDALSPLLVSQLLALLVVLLSYHYWKQLLVSMLVGLASLNAFLWVFS